MTNSLPIYSDLFQGEAICPFNGFERSLIQSPLEHYRQCRSLFRCSDFSSEYQRLSRYPYAKSYQPSIAAMALLSYALKKNHPPVVARLLPSGAPEENGDHFLPLPIAWELSEMWSRLGKICNDFELIEKAELLRNWVKKFYRSGKKLYYTENLFEEKELAGRPIEPSSASPASDLHLGQVAYSSSFLDASVTLSGFNSGLGSLEFVSGVSIPAFGPYVLPLSRVEGFGLKQKKAWDSVILTKKDGIELDGWTRCFGRNESWMEVMAKISDSSMCLKVRFFEGEVDSPMYMAFFVRASKCFLEGSEKTFYPGSLESYKGKKVRAIRFNDRVLLKCKEGVNSELQIIPLAGENCFWNANFLIAFSCPSNVILSFELSL